MAKKMIRPLRSEADHEAALEEIERSFDKEPRPGTPEVDRFELPALMIEDYELKNWPIEPPDAIAPSVTGWKPAVTAKPIWDALLFDCALL